MSIPALSKVFFCRELSWGGTPAAAVWYLLPVPSISMTTTYEAILDNALRGVAAKDFDQYQGPASTEISVEGHFYPDRVPYFMAAITGGEDAWGTPAAGTPGSHIFKLGNTTRSFCFEKVVSLGTPGTTVGSARYRYFGGLVNSFTFRFSSAEGVAGWSASLNAKKELINSGSAPSDSTTLDSPPLLGWTGLAYIKAADTAIGSMFTTPYAQLIDAELTLTREVVLQHTADGSQDPGFGHIGLLEVTLRMTVEIFADAGADVEEQGWYRGASGIFTKKAIALEVTNNQSGTAKRMVQLILPNAVLESPPDLDFGAANLKASLSWRGLYSSAAAYLSNIWLRIDNNQLDFDTIP